LFFPAKMNLSVTLVFIHAASCDDRNPTENSDLIFLFSLPIEKTAVSLAARSKPTRRCLNTATLVRPRNAATLVCPYNAATLVRA
jgi:hypothetical protein